MKPIRRIPVLLVAALAVGTGAPAHAAPAAPTTYESPYEAAVGWTYVDCQADATCAPEGSATVLGVAHADVTYQRETPTTGDEGTSGHGRITETLRVPHKARAVTVTLVWQVSGATSKAATTQAGRVFTGTYLRASAFCGGGKCKAAPVQTEVTYCGAELTHGPVCETASGERTVTSSLSLTEVTGPSVQITTEAAAFAGGRRGCLLVRGDGSCSQEAPDETHAGSATSSIDARLISISISRTGG